MKLQGRVAIVTGGGGAIGAACAHLFAREGACVALVDRDADAMREVLAAIRQGGGEALACPGEVADVGTIDAHVAAVRAAWGRIDILVTAAGVSCGGTVTTTQPDDWAQVMRTNVDGTWLWCRAVVPLMQAQGGGAIVTVASQLAVAGGHRNSAYTASKGAVIALTRTMALDYVADGIRVNAVAPGATDTAMLARAFQRAADPLAAREGSRKRHPMQRFARPEEIAEAILYLAGASASFVTGVVLPVDGGWLAA